MHFLGAMDKAMLWAVAPMLFVWGLLHAYVFWRLGSLPWISGTIPQWGLILSGVVLWSSFVISRVVDATGMLRTAKVLEPAACAWIGVLFLLLSLFLLVDIVTLAGTLFSGHLHLLRSGAFVLAIVLAIWGTVIALRPPIVREMEVSLRGLPPDADGLSLVLISDLHLGSLLGAGWLQKVIHQINQLKPDLIAIAGDLADHHYGRVEAMLPLLRTLSAPHGVWAVTGNHDAYAGLDRMQQLMSDAGYEVLSDKVAQVLPGLNIAGVDDLSVPLQGNGASRHDPIGSVVKAAPQGALILISHTPLEVEKAASNGVGLMLCGHTHGGQLWPFNYLVRLRYGYLGGAYQVDQMMLVVCRGTGTWGPRMRLWHPSEIWRLRLRAADDFSE